MATKSYLLSNIYTTVVKQVKIAKFADLKVVSNGKVTPP